MIDRLDWTSPVAADAVKSSIPRLANQTGAHHRMNSSDIAARGPRTVRILGTHGVPANYGGFETAAENVGLFLRDQGWRVIVYCQVPGDGAVTEDTWHGLERVNIPVKREGWLGTSEFDFRSIVHASRFRDICLTFGYNTAVFNVVQRIKRIPNVINMDGIEWSRARWGKMKQTILWVNERIACWVGNDLIADHPVIEEYLATRARRSKITTITYGANAVDGAPTEPVTSLGLVPGEYLTLICRPIPENSILELVKGFSSKRRDHTLVVLGSYTPEFDAYHRAVIDAASDEVVFPGSVYDPQRLAAIRFHSSGYLHGHTVGGTNPSLVEAMAAGNAVIAHDNAYNRWVAGDGALYFATDEDAADRVTQILEDPGLRRRLGAASRARHAIEFTWERIGGQYQDLLDRHRATASRVPTQQGLSKGEK
jgi:glycosyltransferase involved in cell wall biosynthesis